MLSNVYTKIRAIIEDWSQSDYETFTGSTSLVLSLTETNVSSITSVTKNGVTLTVTTDYS